MLFVLLVFIITGCKTTPGVLEPAFNPASLELQQQYPVVDQQHGLTDNTQENEIVNNKLATDCNLAVIFSEKKLPAEAFKNLQIQYSPYRAGLTESLLSLTETSMPVAFKTAMQNLTGGTAGCKNNLIKNYLSRIYLVGTSNISGGVKSITENNHCSLVYDLNKMPGQDVIKNQIAQCFWRYSNIEQAKWQQLAHGRFEYGNNVLKNRFGYEQDYFVDMQYLEPYGLLEIDSVESAIIDQTSYIYNVLFSAEKTGQHASWSKVYAKRYETVLLSLNRIAPQYVSSQLSQIKNVASKANQIKKETTDYGLIYTRVTADNRLDANSARYPVNRLAYSSKSNLLVTTWGDPARLFIYAESAARLDNEQILTLPRGIKLLSFDDHQNKEKRRLAITTEPAASLDLDKRTNQVQIFHMPQRDLVARYNDSRFWYDLSWYADNSLLLSSYNPLTEKGSSLSLFDSKKLNQLKTVSTQRYSRLDLAVNAATLKDKLITSAISDDPDLQIRNKRSFKLERNLKCAGTGSKAVVAPDTGFIVSTSGFYYLCIFDTTDNFSSRKVYIGTRSDSGTTEAALSMNQKYAFIAVNEGTGSITSGIENLNRSRLYKIDLYSASVAAIVHLPVTASQITVNREHIIVAGTYKEPDKANPDARLIFVDIDYKPE